jgi:hypothetical protein
MLPLPQYPGALLRSLVDHLEAERNPPAPSPATRGPRSKGLEKVLLRWECSTMTLTADSKGRIACLDLKGSVRENDSAEKPPATF